MTSRARAGHVTQASPPPPPRVAAVFELSVPPQPPLGALRAARSQGPGRAGRGFGACGGRGPGAGDRASGAGTDADVALANLCARRSDEDGRALDAVLLAQLLPVLPCPHRHHPAGRLVPGERGRATRGPPILRAAQLAPLVPSRSASAWGAARDHPPKVVLLES